MNYFSKYCFEHTKVIDDSHNDFHIHCVDLYGFEGVGSKPSFQEKKGWHS